jgi:hypothetical protein
MKCLACSMAVVIVYHSGSWEVLAVDTGNGYHFLQDIEVEEGIDGGPPGGAVGGSGRDHHRG